MDKMDNVYEVIFQDEYNNLYLIGFYDSLEDKELIDELNSQLSLYDDIEPLSSGDLKEYASTFSSCFDKEFYSESGCVYVRGFILNRYALINALEEN